MTKYKVTFEINNYVSGSITPVVDGIEGPKFNDPGLHVWHVDSDGDGVLFFKYDDSDNDD